MEGDSSIDLKLDEAAQSRIAHIEYLNATKDWGMKLGKLIEPIVTVVRILLSDQGKEHPTETLEMLRTMMPVTIGMLVKHSNDYYDIFQHEATKVIGGPFQIHEGHHPKCGEIDGICGHQDHYLEEEK